MKTILSTSIVLAGAFVWLGCSHFNKTAGTTHEPKQYAQRKLSSATDLRAAWAYDPGPSADTKMGKELIDIVAEQPYMPGISKEMTGEQKFRPAFGPTLWRMIQEPNSVKILFIGQDGTHIAEAAGRTATAGFGGRGQDMAAYFGVNTGAAFMNTFAFTIRGQYAAFSAPIITEENGVKKVTMGTVVDNGTWMMSQDQNSPMVKWRNSLIDWIMRNNRESLRMVVVFGGSAQDSIGTFIESRGGKVGTSFTNADLQKKNVRIPELDLVPAGSNKVFPVIVDRNGRDLYTKLVGRKLDYSKPADQKAATDALTKNISSVYQDLVITNTGLENSGVVHPAQIRGYDLNKIEIDGNRTLSLKGMKLSDGSELEHDVLVAEFPHPTALSMNEMQNPGSASIAIAKSLKNIIPYREAGWKIEPDPGMVNQFQAKGPYKYGRTDIPRAYYDFGTPNNRMVSKSDASRMSGKPNIVILGTRDKAQFDARALSSATIAKPNQAVNSGEMWTARPRSNTDRYVFDAGPGIEMARIMKENLDMKAIGKIKKGFKLKAGVKMDKGETIEDVADVDGFNIKTHPIAVGDHGHYRGTFDNPKVVILADPAGVDEILTSRAMTGTRGQYLQGLMNKIGVNENHLVIRTVPFGMDNATNEEWTTVLEQTKNYRTAIFNQILKNGTPDLIIADGPHAEKEISRLVKSKIPIVTINREGIDNESGISNALDAINQTGAFKKASGEVTMANIPRSHLGFMSRVWEGTSGTRVFNTRSPEANGIGFAVVVPAWAFNQKDVKQDREERMGIDKLKGTLQENHIPLIQERFKKKSGDDDDDAYFFFPHRFEDNSIAA